MTMMVILYQHKDYNPKLKNQRENQVRCRKDWLVCSVEEILVQVDKTKMRNRSFQLYHQSVEARKRQEAYHLLLEANQRRTLLPKRSNQRKQYDLLIQTMTILMQERRQTKIRSRSLRLVATNQRCLCYLTKDLMRRKALVMMATSLRSCLTLLLLKLKQNQSQRNQCSRRMIAMTQMSSNLSRKNHLPSLPPRDYLPLEVKPQRLLRNNPKRNLNRRQT